MRGVSTRFGFSQPSWSYYMCFAKVVSINNQLKIRRLQNRQVFVICAVEDP